MRILLFILPAVLAPFHLWELWRAATLGKVRGLQYSWPWPSFDRKAEPKIFWTYVVAHSVWIVMLVQVLAWMSGIAE